MWFAIGTTFRCPLSRVSIQFLISTRVLFFNPRLDYVIHSLLFLSLFRYGFFATNNRYFFCYDPVTMEKIFTKIRNGGKYCDSIGPYKVIYSIIQLQHPPYGILSTFRSYPYPLSYSFIHLSSSFFFLADRFEISAI